MGTVGSGWPVNAVLHFELQVQGWFCSGLGYDWLTTWRSSKKGFTNLLFIGIRQRDCCYIHGTSTTLELYMYPMNSLYKFLSLAGLTLLTALLVACGGGGGGDAPPPSPPPAPTLLLTYDTNQITFRWEAVEGATYYQLFENPDGVSGYTQIGGDLVSTTYEASISLPQRVNASYLLKACNDKGCSSSADLSVATELSAAVGYVKASNSNAGDTFGYAIALSRDGNTLAIGAAGPSPANNPPIDNLLPGAGESSGATGVGGDQADNSANSAGAVYLFSRSNGSWVQQQYIKATNSAANDYFGWSLALSGDGNTLAVGAPGEASNATGVDGNQGDNSAPQSGAVYVYSRSDSAWTPQSYLKASNSEASDFFGWSLALSADGNTLAVGAYGEDSNAKGVNGNQGNNSHLLAGAAYIFSRTANAWAQQAYLKASNTDSASANPQFGGDYFGWSLDISSDGNTVAVGAFGEDGGAMGVDGAQNNNDAPDSGAVHTFIRSSGSWSPQSYLKASNTNISDKFGMSVRLSGNGTTLAISAPNEDSSATQINGNQSDNSAPESGAVYLFSHDGANWQQQSYIKASNTDTTDWFGMALAISEDGNTLAVGAPYEASSGSGANANPNDNSAAYSGAIYLYTRSASLWSHQLYAKASNAQGNDGFGRSLALSADASRIAVGAPYESSNATGIGGNQGDNSAAHAGAVYLY